MTTTIVHSPATDFHVLDRPYTAAEYNALPCLGRDGEITRVVSLPLSDLLETGSERALERLCSAVVSELGQWQLYSYIALGPATAFGHRDAEILSETGTWQTRSRIVKSAPEAETEPRFGETLFQVRMSPGLAEDVDVDDACLCDSILPCPVHDH